VGVVFAASVAFNIPLVKLMADPVQIYQSKFYIGFLSNLTAVTWAVGAYCALFCWRVLKHSGDESEWTRFFKLGGIFTLILMVDDLFMFHERIFPHHLFLPEITGLRPNEKIPIGFYGLFAMYFLYSCRGTIRKTSVLQMGVAVGLLASSVIIDRGIGKYIAPNKTVHYLVEDGAKFLGALGWSWYFAQTAKTVLLVRVRGMNIDPASASARVPEKVAA
jgi:hypothetical protein